jgi:hypothetical protein
VFFESNDIMSHCNPALHLLFENNVAPDALAKPRRIGIVSFVPLLEVRQRFELGIRSMIPF